MRSSANGATPQYNGNIAGMIWRTNTGGTCINRQQYRFTYDYNNRLTAASHYTHNGSAWTFTNNYSESNISYDLNGNLKTYTRRGLKPNSTYDNIDVLTYTYGDAARPDRLTSRCNQRLVATVNAVEVSNDQCARLRLADRSRELLVAGKDWHGVERH